MTTNLITFAFWGLSNPEIMPVDDVATEFVASVISHIDGAKKTTEKVAYHAELFSGVDELTIGEVALISKFDFYTAVINKLDEFDAVNMDAIANFIFSIFNAINKHNHELINAEIKELEE